MRKKIEDIISHPCPKCDHIHLGSGPQCVFFRVEPCAKCKNTIKENDRRAYGEAGTNLYGRVFCLPCYERDSSNKYVSTVELIA